MEEGSGVVAEVKLLSPRPGDVIVVRMRERVEASVLERVAKTLRAELPEGVKGVVADVGIEDVVVLRAAATEA